MQNLGTLKRNVFLKDHPPVTGNLLFGSTGAELHLVAGSVIGNKTEDGKNYLYIQDEGVTVKGILAEDITVPASGDQMGLTYIHAAVIRSELIWDESVTAEQQKTALAALRAVGIFAGEE